MDIIKHGEWAVPKLVEIAVRSWPDEKLFIPIRGALAETDWTACEHIALRKAGLTRAIIVDGMPFVSSSFMSIGRTTLRAATEASELIGKLAYAESHLSELGPVFEKAASLAGVQPALCPQYEVVSVTNPQSFGFGIREVTTDLVVGIL